MYSVKIMIHLTARVFEISSTSQILRRDTWQRYGQQQKENSPLLSELSISAVVEVILCLNLWLPWSMFLDKRSHCSSLIGELATSRFVLLNLLELPESCIGGRNNT